MYLILRRIYYLWLTNQKKHRKFVATAATATLVATAVAPVAGFAADVELKDVAGHWSEKHVNYLVNSGAIEGYPDGTFKPDGKITRAEVATILAKTFDLEIDKNAKTTFADAKDHWASAAIAAIQKDLPGVINGYEDQTFRPDRQITREEMAKMIVEAYELELDETQEVSFKDDSKIQDWAYDYVYTLASLGVVQGRDTGNFDPAANVTRGETATFVHRAEVPAERVIEELDVVSAKALDATTVQVEFTDGNTENFTVDKLEVGVETEVEVEYKGETFKVKVTYDPNQTAAPGTVAFASQPAAKSLPFSSQLNEVYSFQITAGEDAITLRSVQLKQYGTAQATEKDIANVHLSVNGEIQATGTLNANNEVRLTRSVTIPANSTVEFTVLADIGAEATPTATIQFGVESINAFTANAVLNGSFPNVGNAFSVVAGNIGNVTVTPVHGSDYDLETGDEQEEVGKFTLQAGSEEGVKVKRITLSTNGFNADEFENLYLYENNGADKIDVQGVATRNEVVFDLSDADIEIGRNQAKSFVLKGDPLEAVTNGSFEISESYHVVTEGLNTGYNNGNNIGNLSSAHKKLGAIDVTLGGPKFRVSTNSPKSGDKIVASTSEYGVVREYTLNPAGQDITLKDAHFEIHWNNASPTASELRDSIRAIELYDPATGAVLKTYDIPKKPSDSALPNPIVDTLKGINWNIDKPMNLQVRAIATSDSVNVKQFDVLITKLDYEILTATGKKETDDVSGPVGSPQYKEFTTQGNVETTQPGSDDRVAGYSISGGLSNAPLGGIRLEAKDESLKVEELKVSLRDTTIESNEITGHSKLTNDVTLSKLITNPVLTHNGEVVAYGDIKTGDGEEYIEFDFDQEFVIETGQSNRKVLNLQADILENDDARDLNLDVLLTGLETRGANSNIVTKLSEASLVSQDGQLSFLEEKSERITYRDTTVAVEVDTEAIDTVASTNTNILKFTVKNLAPNDPTNGSKKAVIEEIGFENLFTFPARSNVTEDGNDKQNTPFVLRTSKLELFKGFAESEIGDNLKSLTLTPATNWVLDGDDDETAYLYGDLTLRDTNYDNRSIFHNVRMRLDAKNWTVSENDDYRDGGDLGSPKTITPLYINKGKGPDITIRD